MSQLTIKRILWFTIIMGLLGAITACHTPEKVKKVHDNRETDTVIVVGLSEYVSLPDSPFRVDTLKSRDTIKMLLQWGYKQTILKGDTVSLWRFSKFTERTSMWHLNPYGIYSALPTDSVEYRNAIVYLIPEDKL